MRLVAKRGGRLSGNIILDRKGNPLALPFLLLLGLFLLLENNAISSLDCHYETQNNF